MKRLMALSALTAALAGCTQEHGVTDPTSPAAPFAQVVAEVVSCPSNGVPLPGTTVSSGLRVDGRCVLEDITVNGGIVVGPGGDLEVESSTVNGGVAVSRCGELDVDLADHSAPSGATSTINGDVVIEASASCTSPAFSDVDIWTARINGQVSITGDYLGGPSICGNEITGNVSLDHVTAAHPLWLGDPDGVFGCPGNTIRGTLAVNYSSASVLEVEANTVTKSVLLSGSTLEASENRIGGSLLCSNGTVILAGEPDDDPVGNMVHGANTCG
jgi:hypothetical protein